MFSLITVNTGRSFNIMISWKLKLFHNNLLKFFLDDESQLDSSDSISSDSDTLTGKIPFLNKNIVLDLIIESLIFGIHLI